VTDFSDELPIPIAAASRTSPESASSAVPAGQVAFPTAFDAVFDSSGEALLMVGRRFRNPDSFSQPFRSFLRGTASIPEAKFSGPIRERETCC